MYRVFQHPGLSGHFAPIFLQRRRYAALLDRRLSPVFAFERFASLRDKPNEASLHQVTAALVRTFSLDGTTDLARTR